MNQELAEIISLQAVSFIAEDEDRLSALFQETGLSVGDFQDLAENPYTLAGVLDFLLAHEEILVEFCEKNNINPEMPLKIRRFFPGGSEEFYTP
jgi:Protein of unknown function (DUF3572)